MKEFLDYWQCAMQVQHLHELQPKQIQRSCQFISRAECDAGKIKDRSVIDKLVASNDCVVIAPYYALREDNQFFPYMLIAGLTVDGSLVVKAHLSLPIIPRTVLEPAPLWPCSLGLAENFDNYIAINQPGWLENHKELTWNTQLQYAQEVLTNVNSKWQEDLFGAGYIVQEGALVFTFPTLTRLQIATVPEDIKLIDSAVGFDTTSYVKQLIVDAWVNAALCQASPPRYVWLHPDKEIKYATIFNCMPTDASLDIVIYNSIHAYLVAEHENYMQGKQLLSNWREVVERSRIKNVAQLQVNLKDAKIQIKNLQVLRSIWQCQKELLVNWSKFLDFIPFMQRSRLQRLYSFYKQNFPNDNVEGLTLPQLDELLVEKMRRLENTERIIADTLHQIDSDAYQEKIVRDKCLQWCERQKIFFDKIDDITTYMQSTMWQHIACIAQIYWQQYFSEEEQKCLDLAQMETQKIDVLIAEHAQYIHPIQAAELLSISDSAVVIGNYNAISNQRFPVQLDYELTKYFSLAEDDLSFEDLQFSGELVSVGSMWNMMAYDREADQQFIDVVQNTLRYEYIDVQTHSAKHAGSMLNLGVTKVVLAWLQENYIDRADVAIYTCFSAQVRDIRSALAGGIFAEVPVLLVQQPWFLKSKISLFVPVYTQRDARPYIFDSGCEMLDQLVANTKQRLIVLGDMRIFKPELHSASGKLAKLLFKTEKEVSSV